MLVTSQVFEEEKRNGRRENSKVDAIGADDIPRAQKWLPKFPRASRHHALPTSKSGS
jgi:hypothetical protein